MIKHFLLFALLLSGFYANSQNTYPLEFKKTTHDFGALKESTGEAKTIFKFKNIGKNPIFIEKVFASCGCTTTKYSKNIIMPGKSGSVEAIFHTANSYGIFNKYIIVYINDTSNKGVYLYLKGYVYKGETLKEELYTQAKGQLRFRSNHVAFNIVKTNQKKTDTLWIYNSSEKKMKIEFKALPVWVSISPQKVSLKSKSDNYFLVTYDGSKRNDWGLNFDKITMITNDTVSEKDVYISAQLEEDFSKADSSQLKNAPVAYFKEPGFEFGEVKEGSNIFHRFELINIGKSDLIIRKVTTSCGCTISNVDKTMLKPGENCFVTASFNTGGRSGEQHKTITVVTNDPINTKIVLSLTGTVIQ